MVNLHSLMVHSYQHYVGSVAQHTAVNIGEAARALNRLFADPTLRARMGEAGQQRAGRLFSWPVVIGQYNVLFAELAATRDKAQADQKGFQTRMHPFRGDPYRDFEAFATSALKDSTELRRIEGTWSLEDLMSVELCRQFSQYRPPEPTLRVLLEQLKTDQTISLQELLKTIPLADQPRTRMGVIWLAKHGLIDWTTPHQYKD